MIIGYLDPASGSAIISAVVAGTAGAGVAAKTVFAKMRLRNRTVSVEDRPADEEITDDEPVDEPSQ